MNYLIVCGVKSYVTAFFSRPINFDSFCGASKSTFFLPAKPLITEPLITNNDPLLIKRALRAPPPSQPPHQLFPAPRHLACDLDTAGPARGGAGAAWAAAIGGGGVRFGSFSAAFLPTCPLFQVR